MDLLDLIKSRRTIRKYKDKNVSREIVDKIIDAGRWAPSVHNMQPWRFVVISDKDKIERVAYILNDKANSLLSGVNVVMRDSAEKLRNSPVIIFVYNDEQTTNRFGRFGETYKEIGSRYDTQSVANAIENMLLYSHSRGLGMAWYGIALFCENELNDFLVKSDKLSAVLSLGYPDEVPDSSKRKNITEITEYIG